MPGLPIHTPRLTVRMMRSADAATLAAYRNDPDVARHMVYDLPYTLDDALAALAGQEHLDDIGPGVRTRLAIDLDGAMIGDVYASLDGTGGVAEIGYALAPGYEGAGYASEAAGAVVTDLFERFGVGRVRADLDPENIGSQRVLERIGLIYEGVTLQSYFCRGEWTDNMSYAATRQQHDTWRNRPRNRPDEVRLVVLDAGNEGHFRNQFVHHSQERFVSQTLRSYIEALFPDEVDGALLVPWMRGIEADGVPVGFLMTAEVTDHHPEPYLWKLLIGRLHQRRGIGERVLALLFDRLRAEGHTTVVTSWGEGPGSPRRFYERLGFVPTGNVVDGETEARLNL